MKDGYIYSYSAAEFMRTPIKFDPDEDETESGRPFSVVDLYKAKDELDLLRISTDKEVREQAEAEFDNLQGDFSSELWRDGLGLIPTEEEMMKLAGILVLAVPYAPRAE